MRYVNLIRELKGLIMNGVPMRLHGPTCKSAGNSSPLINVNRRFESTITVLKQLRFHGDAIKHVEEPLL